MKNPWLIVLLLCLLTFGVYFKSLSNDFVNYDDPALAFENKQVRRFDFHEVFTSKVAEDYIPLVVTTYAAEHALFGMNPFYFHLDNILLHILNVVLVFYFIYLMTSGQLFVAGFAALLFAVHPLHVESVAWISERKDVLSMALFMMALILYWQFLFRHKGKSYWRYLVAFIFFTLALFAKFMAVSLPAILILLHIQKKDSWKKTALLQIPYAIVAGIFTYVHLLMHNQGRHELSLIRGIDSLVFYINKTVFPAGLSAFYQRGVVSIAWHEYLVATAVLLILAFFATRSQNNKDAVFFGGLFFLATIFPVLQIVPFGNDFAFADRFMYLPSVGIFYFVSVIWLWFFENRASVLKIVSCGAVIALGVLFSYTSFKRSLVWANSQSLWEDEVAKYPNSSIARNNLGSLYLDRGRYDEAIAELKASAELKPTYVDPHVNLGVAYLDLNKLEEAQKELEQAIRLDPNTPKAHLNLGVIAEKTGNLDAAFFHYKEAVRMDPEFSFARHNLGVIYYRRHDVEKALEIFRETVKMDPTLTETYHNIGVILLEKEQIDDAIKAFNESARLDPYYLEPHLQLFRIYQKLQRQELVVQEGKTIQDIQNRVKNNPRPRSRRFK